MTDARYDRIVLTGFMGAGKSTLGPLLAERLGWAFLDLDREVERRESRTVPQIFAEQGEAAFRAAEVSALTDLLARQHVVIALGGGAPEEQGIRKLLDTSSRTAVIYLAADFATLAQRCKVQAENPGSTSRPNFADETLAEERFTRRHPLYQSIATHTLQTSAHSAQTAIDELWGMLNC